MDNKIKRNINIYHITQLLGELDFTLPIYVLFGKNYLGLNYTQVSFLTITSFTSSIAFDFILGLFADSFSRKKSYLLGIFLQILGLLPFIFTKDYSLLILGASLVGMGNAFHSNVLDTLVHEDLHENNLIEHYAPVTSKAQQMFYFGRVISGVLGGVLFFISPTLPYIFYALALSVCFTLAAILLKEGSFSKQKNNFIATTKAALAFLSSRKDILYFCFVGLVISLFADLLFGYYQPYFNTFNIPSFYIGALYSVIALVSSYGSHLMKTWLPKYSAKRLNAYMMLACIATAIFMLPQIPVLAFIGPLFIALTFGFLVPNLRHYLNSRSPSEIKTSVASLGTTSYAVGTMIGLSTAGILADHFSSTIILSVIIGGSVITLVLNNFLKG